MVNNVAAVASLTFFGGLFLWLLPRL
jgi:hypothetical protein